MIYPTFWSTSVTFWCILTCTRNIWQNLTRSWPDSTKPPQNKPRKMCLGKQGSLLPGLHTNSRWNQAQKKTQGNQRCQTSNGYQTDQILHWTVQIVLVAHQGFHINCSTPILADSQRLQIQTLGKARPLAHQDAESTINGLAGTQFCNSIQEGIQHAS